MKVRWLASARRDSDRALAWYSTRNPALAIDLLDEIDTAVARLLEAPNLWPFWKPPAIRCCVFQRFPYLLYYRCDADLLTIVAFVHQRQDPSRRP